MRLTPRVPKPAVSMSPHSSPATPNAPCLSSSAPNARRTCPELTDFRTSIWISLQLGFEEEPLAQPWKKQGRESLGLTPCYSLLGPAHTKSVRCGMCYESDTQTQCKLLRIFELGPINAFISALGIAVTNPSSLKRASWRNEHMAPILCSVARVRAGLTTVVEMVGGPARMELDVIARPQSMHRPYKVRIPIAIQCKV